MGETCAYLCEFGWSLCVFVRILMIFVRFCIYLCTCMRFCIVLWTFMFLLYYLYDYLRDFKHLGRIFQQIYVFFKNISEGGCTEIWKFQILIFINNFMVVGRARCHTANMYLVNGSLDPQSMPTWGCMPTPIMSKNVIS